MYLLELFNSQLLSLLFRYIIYIYIYISIQASINCEGYETPIEIQSIPYQISILDLILPDMSWSHSKQKFLLEYYEMSQLYSLPCLLKTSPSELVEVFKKGPFTLSLWDEHYSHHKNEINRTK